MKIYRKRIKRIGGSGNKKTNEDRIAGTRKDAKDSSLADSMKGLNRSSEGNGI